MHSNPQTDALCAAVSLLTTVAHDVDLDATLPEYMPVIRRVISVEMTPLPESRFLRGGAFEFGGTAAFSVLYIGEDDALFCVPLTAEYSASTALGGATLDDASAVAVDTEAESVSCRVTAPRKLTLRARMHSRLYAVSAASVADSIDGATVTDEIGMERRIAESPDLRMAHGSLTATVADSFPLSPDTRIIHCTAAPRIEESRAEAGAVAVSGSVLLHVFCRTPDGRFDTLEMKTPFSEVIPVPDAQPGDASRAWGRCAAVTVREADGVVQWEAEFDWEAEAVRASSVRYTADAYSIVCPVELTTTETDSLRLLRCGNQALHVSGSVGRRSKAAEGENIIRASAVASPESVEYEGGRVILHGTVAVSVWIAADGDIVSEEGTIPFRCEAEAADVPEGELFFRCAAAVLQIGARTEGDALAIEAELCVSLCVISREKIRYVSRIALHRNEAYADGGDVLRICYPDVGEPLWDIAKKYAVSRRALCETNGIADADSLCDGTPLLIE